MLFLDTETVGFHGPIVLIQYAVDMGPVQLHNVWTNPVGETLQLIEWMCSQTVCAFNLTFDWFHICQSYTTLSLFRDRYGDDALPEDNIQGYAELESAARDGPCLKPVGAVDLLLHAKKGPYQSVMARKPIVLKRVPTVLAQELADKLETLIQIPDIFFARRKKVRAKWQVVETKNPQLSDVVLRFDPSASLKSLAVDALGMKVTQFKEVGVKTKVVEFGWAPFYQPGVFGMWPSHIREHIKLWAYNDLAIKYATLDVEMLQKLWVYFGKPDCDVESRLACLVGAARWKGYAINRTKVQALFEAEKARLQEVPRGVKALLAWLKEVLSEDEQLVLFNSKGRPSTNKLILRKLVTWKDETGPHPVAARAQAILDKRKADYRLGIYNKLLQANRLHADFKVIGAKSSRMSGTGRLNAHAFEKLKEVRDAFDLGFEGEVTEGGDFTSFEVTIAAAAYKDPVLHADLEASNQPGGKKLHGIMGTLIYPPKTYEQIVASSGKEDDLYTKAKSGFFAVLYFGEGYTLATKLEVPIDVADSAVRRMMQRYKVMGEKREWFTKNYSGLQQPDGPGSKVLWTDPLDYAETLYGFKRYFTIENKISKALFMLAQNPPKEWVALDLKIERNKKKIQTVSGAVQSALYGAAFALQAANKRAAGNHFIQGTGSHITKAVQDSLWEYQPAGVHPWVVRPMNVHDEILCPSNGKVDLRAKVDATIKQHRSTVALLDMAWKRIKSWAMK